MSRLPGPGTKRPSTKALLIDAAEQLISERGFEGVTLREIAQLAGQANESAVQYHFGDKLGLIAAIMEDRIAHRETMRADALAAVKAAGRQDDSRELLSILWLPALALTNDAGEHVFARFSLQCLLQPGFVHRYPLYDPVALGRDHGVPANASALTEVMALLRAVYADMAPDLFAQRLLSLSLMFTSCAVEFDNRKRLDPTTAAFDLTGILDMAVTSMALPAQPDAAPLIARAVVRAYRPMTDK